MNKNVILLIVFISYSLSVFSQHRNRYSMKLDQQTDGTYKLRDEKKIRARINPDTLSDLYMPYHITGMPVDKKLFSTTKHTYTTHNDKAVEMEIDLPNNGENHPFIIYIHGGGWTVGSMFSFRNHSQYMATNGIAGIRISYTLINDGGNFELAISQIKQVLGYLREYNDEFKLNLDQFGFCGSSAGAVLSGFAAMTIPGCKVLIGQDGTYDMANTRPGNFPTVITKQQFFDNADSEVLKKLSAINNIPPNPPAVILMHGSADTVIDWQESDKFAEALQRRKAVVEYCLYENYEHACTAYADIYQDVLKKMLSFAAKYLRQ